MTVFQWSLKWVVLYTERLHVLFQIVITWQIEILSSNFFIFSFINRTIRTNILSVTVTPPPAAFLQPPIEILLKHENVSHQLQQYFWRFSWSAHLKKLYLNTPTHSLTLSKTSQLSECKTHLAFKKLLNLKSIDPLIITQQLHSVLSRFNYRLESH